MEEKYQNVPLNPLRAFAIASRHKTFTAAAKHMGVTQVAISRQISILEDYLGVQLFERGARSAKLTEHGRTFGQEIAPLFDSIERSTQRLLLKEREYVINLRVYPTLAHHFLLPRLTKFAKVFSEFNVRLDTTVEPLDFRGTHLDVAIQLGSGIWKDSRSRKLFPETLDVVCSPAYEQRLKEGKTVARILHSKYRRRAWNDWAKLSKIATQIEQEVEFESSLLTYSAAISGLGLAVGQLEILQRELQEATLVTPFNSPQTTLSEFYIVWPTTKSTSKQTKRFIDWLLTESGQEPEFFKSQS